MIADLSEELNRFLYKIEDVVNLNYATNQKQLLINYDRWAIIHTGIPPGITTKCLEGVRIYLYCINGKAHRDRDAPSFLWCDIERNRYYDSTWYKYDKQHRDKGPSYIGIFDTTYVKEWYNKGIRIKKESGFYSESNESDIYRPPLYVDGKYTKEAYNIFFKDSRSYQV